MLADDVEVLKESRNNKSSILAYIIMELWKDEEIEKISILFQNE